MLKRSLFEKIQDWLIVFMISLVLTACLAPLDRLFESDVMTQSLPMTMNVEFGAFCALPLNRVGESCSVSGATGRITFTVAQNEDGVAEIATSPY